MPAVFLVASILSSCVEQNGPAGGLQGEGTSGLFAFDTRSRGKIPKIPFGDQSGGSQQTGVIYAGSPPVAGLPSAPTPTPAGPTPDGTIVASDGPIASAGGYQLNFENADAGAVSKAILGDILQANYSVDRRVTGQITLTSSQPVPRARLVPLLESALASIGAAVVKDQDLYRVVPSAEAGAIAGARHSGEGFGTTVITAHYMPAANLGHLLEDFGSRSGSVHVDEGTNLVVVQGTAAERQSAVEAAGLVDVDWLRSKSVGILPVANASPETVIGELEHIIDSGEGGRAQGAIQLQPLDRMNAVLVVARQREGVELVRRWMSRLDRVDAAAAGIKVYKLEYAQAKNVATMLTDLFGNGPSAGADKDALEPSAQGSSQVAAPPAQASAAGASAGASSAAGTGGGASSPFGTLKTAFDADAKAKALANDGDAGSARQKIRVTADASTNSLLINASAPDYKLIERAIRQMDRPPVQVDIEATIAEVTLNKDLQYGIQFYLHNTDVGAGLAGAAGLPTASSIAQGLNLLVGNLSSPKLLLQALSSITDVKILSSPNLVVLDRQPAVLQVGDQVPVLTRTAQSVDTALSPTVNSVDYKDTGIILNVLPRVNANGVVTLDVEQQISAVTSTDTTTLTPTISQRRVRSEIAVANGQTVMLAGLISEKQSETRSGLPGLSSINFLNDILTSHGSARDRTEIIIFIRPQIIASSADAQQVTEEFQNRLTSMQRVTPRPLIRKY